MKIDIHLYIVSDASRLEQLSNGLCDVNDQEEVMRELSSILAGGFKFPLTFETPYNVAGEKRGAGRRVAA